MEWKKEKRTRKDINGWVEHVFAIGEQSRACRDDRAANEWPGKLNGIRSG